MAELKQYDPSKPLISVNLPSKEELIAATLGLIPGYRSLKNMYDNPEGPISETLDLAAEDFIRLYGSLIKPAINGDDIDVEQALKEAAIFGIPMPYTKFPKGHPKAGEPIPNNLKEAWGKHRFSNARWNWRNNTNKAPKLLKNPEQLRYNGPAKQAISTRARTNASTSTNSPIVTPAGPYIRTNTGTAVIGTGRQAMNTNTRSRNQARAQTKNLGKQGWQGEMYPPGRTLRIDDMYGPFSWESKYSHKLDKTLERNELDWEYLINETRTPPAGNRNADRMTKLSKDEVADIALAQGRPDIAERVMQDNKPRIMPNEQPIFRTIKSSIKTAGLDNKTWKDLGNRKVEKEIREIFATLPKDPTIRQQFAEYYGVPDLYQSWLNDPLIWDKYTDDVLKARTNRERSNASYDRILGRNIQR